MNNDWVKIFTSSDALKSELVKQFLVENEIEAVLLNKQGYPYQIGEAEVYVHPDFADQAKELLASNEI